MADKKKINKKLIEKVLETLSLPLVMTQIEKDLKELLTE